MISAVTSSLTPKCRAMEGMAGAWKAAASMVIKQPINRVINTVHGLATGVSAGAPSGRDMAMGLLMGIFGYFLCRPGGVGGKSSAMQERKDYPVWPRWYTF